MNEITPLPKKIIHSRNPSFFLIFCFVLMIGFFDSCDLIGFLLSNKISLNFCHDEYMPSLFLNIFIVATLFMFFGTNKKFFFSKQTK